MTAATGILPFLKGVNFSYNDFSADKFPSSIDQMKGLKWLKLSRTKLDWIPEELKALDKLEKLCLSHNELVSLHGEIICLENLKYLDCRYNKIHNSDIPEELFNIKALEILDLSHNNLIEIPKNIENCKELKVLNLAYNKLETIKDQVFVNLNKLEDLDLSSNQLKALPTALGRLTNLKILKLNNNPFYEVKFRLIERLKSLESLHMQKTSRDDHNMPPNLSSLENLVELNLSCNKLTRVPEDVTWCKQLRRLNLSENEIIKLPTDFGDFYPNLEILNLSNNKLTELPNSICKLCNLKRLYLNDNKLDFKGLPSALGKLRYLEVFMAASNYLENIPESIIRCSSLKKLILTSNKLKRLPDSIHLLNDLEILELSNNPDLIMPPKPTNESARNAEFYNIDFSLNTQLRLAGDPSLSKTPQLQPNPIKDPIARKLRLRKRAKDDVEQEKKQAKVLKGMKDLVLEKDNLANSICEALESDLKPKRWDEALEKPPIDYSDFFEETAGQIQGLTIWEIENFCPVLMDSRFHGKFYDADCYIVLSTHIDENHSLQWKIFYWIGAESTIDKKACSAIHAVGLRNHLTAQCRTIREEQGEESDEFLDLFPDGIDVVKGARTASGFYIVEEAKYAHRMFRLHEVAEKTRELHLETVDLSSNSLDSRFVFLIDTGYKIFVWNGLKSKNTTKQKARLLGEMLNKEERKNKAELVFCDQGDETPELIEELNLNDTLPKVPFKSVDLNDDLEIDNYQPLRPVLYQVCLGKGYIELPQVEFTSGKMLSKYLIPKNVYILDCLTDVFVWFGRKSSKMERKAALKLAQEIFSMMKRPDFAVITSCSQGTESQLFKTKFKEWDDVIAVDYTRTAESVSKTGADINKWMSEQKVKIDLASLFSDRQEPLSDEDAEVIIEELNNELDTMEAFILEKGKCFARLPENEFGHFYTEDCYVFLCRYIMPLEELDEECQGDPEARLPNGIQMINGHDNADSQSNQEEDFKYVVYFWQGRQASKMGWLTFTFSLQKKFESLFGNKLEVVQMHQQQEDKYKFLSHFKQKFIIHRGKRSEINKKPVELYHLRSNSNPLTLRCIEIDADSANLNSGFCYILKVNNVDLPKQNGYSNGIHGDDFDISHDQTSNQIFVWIGSKAAPSESKIAQEIANEKFHSPALKKTIFVVNEGKEMSAFWLALGRKKEYETSAEFMKHTRLFRCSNDMGYFCISEKCSDFCQDDLSDDDIMILDNGSQIFLWIGPNSSEVEVKLAYKSAQVYVQNLRIKQASQPRQLMLTIKGKESKKFTKCFHGWSQYKIVKDPRGDEFKTKREYIE